MSSQISKKIILISALTLVAFISLSSVCLAEDNGLEINYPPIKSNGKIISLNTSSTFPQYITYIYRFSIWIAGLILAVILISAGVSYITSTGNPARMKEAKAKIISGIIGIIVIFSSYLILYTINPQIVGKKIKIKTPKIGIYLKDTKGRKIMVSDDIYDTGNFKGNYICCFSKNSDIKAIYIFSEKNFRGNSTKINPNSSLYYNTCFASSDINPIKSLKIIWNLPGMYIWTSYKSSISLPYLINGTILDLNTIPALSGTSSWDKIEIKDDATSSFGAILFKGVDFRGEGDVIIGRRNGNTTSSTYFYNYPPAKSIYFFNKDLQNGNASTTFLYSSPQFQKEKQIGEKDVDCQCAGLSPVPPTIYSPMDIPSGPLPSDCALNVRSLKIDPKANNLVILLENGRERSLQAVQPFVWHFDKAEPFSKSDPDLSDNYIGRCTTTPASSQWMDWYSIYHSCATQILAFPIIK